MSLNWQDKHPRTPKEIFFLPPTGKKVVPLFLFVIRCSLLSKDIF